MPIEIRTTQRNENRVWCAHTAKFIACVSFRQIIYIYIYLVNNVLDFYIRATTKKYDDNIECNIETHFELLKSNSNRNTLPNGNSQQFYLVKEIHSFTNLK